MAMRDVCARWQKHCPHSAAEAHLGCRFWGIPSSHPGLPVRAGCAAAPFSLAGRAVHRHISCVDEDGRRGWGCNLEAPPGLRAMLSVQLVPPSPDIRNAGACSRHPGKTERQLHSSSGTNSSTRMKQPALAGLGEQLCPAFPVSRC